MGGKAAHLLPASVEGRIVSRHHLPGKVINGRRSDTAPSQGRNMVVTVLFVPTSLATGKYKWPDVPKSSNGSKPDRNRSTFELRENTRGPRQTGTGLYAQGPPRAPFSTPAADWHSCIFAVGPVPGSARALSAAGAAGLCLPRPNGNFAALCLLHRAEAAAVGAISGVVWELGVKVGLSVGYCTMGGLVGR
jgi:hypothetical protein